MKCGILTFHRAINFGAILQAYALQTSIQKLGIECEIIDYRSSFIEKHYRPLSFRSLINIKKIASILLKNGTVKTNRENFVEFSRQYLNLSSRVYDKEQLIKCNDVFDVFITGSDQVWSYLTAGFDKSYFLDFVKNEGKKNSYAASFGVEYIPENYKNEYFNLLNDYNNISVREEQGAKIIKDILNKDVAVVLDPTLLLGEDDWSQVALKNLENQDYLLVYLIVETKSIILLAKRIAEERNLKVIYISDRLFKIADFDNRSRISVNEWLSLFLNANCIVTNSFHGIAFSINFKKEFFIQYLPLPAKVNSRLESILKKFDLTSRYIEDMDQIDMVENIDYVEVHKKLSCERTKSLEYLKGVFKVNNPKK